jgi:hypothetical protein
MESKMKSVALLMAVCGFALMPGAAFAGSFKSADGAQTNETLSKRGPQVRGYVFRPGGHRYDYELEPFLRRNGPYGNYPDVDPRNFNERVLGDPRDSTTGASAL